MAERLSGTALAVGVLTPHAAAGPEVEIAGMSAGRVAVVVERVRPAGAPASWTPPTSASGLLSLSEPSTMNAAAARFRDAAVAAVAYASTSTGYVLGRRGEAVLVDGVRQACGVPVVSSGRAAVEALRVHGSRRLALVHPPWFDAEVDELGVRYFSAEGLDVSLFQADGLPHDPALVRPAQVVDWVLRHVDGRPDAVFFAGNGFRAAGAIQELERRTGWLVLESNQVLLWSLLAATRTRWGVTGHGRLFGGPR